MITIDKLAKAGLITKTKPDNRKIRDLMATAKHDLRQAQESLARDPVECFAHAYGAVYDVCCAFMRASGYWPRSAPNYRLVLAFCKLSLPPEKKSILAQFEAAENKRHKAMYTGLNSLTLKESIRMLKLADIFINRTFIMIDENR